MAENIKTASELRALIGDSVAEARQLINTLFDEGTFLENGTYVKNGEGYFESVITGGGAVDGRPVFAFVQDGENEKGAFTVSHAKKIARLFDAALRSGAPVVAFFGSCGAKVTENVDVLSAYGSVMAAVAEAKGQIPLIAVVNGVCGGASAILSQMFDVVICTDKAKRYLVSRGAEVGHPHVVSTDAVADVKRLLALLPSNAAEPCPLYDEAEDINVGFDASALTNTDAHELITALSDSEPVFLSESFAEEAITALIRLNGRTVGVVANQPTVNGGAITPKAAKKLAGHIKLCYTFDIPVLTLVNTVGFESGCGNLQAISDLVLTYTCCDSPMITAVVGNAFGSAFTVMGSRALGADMVFALDTALISVLDPDTAVEFIGEEEIKNASDPASARVSLKNKWLSENASPLNAAKSGDVDDIIDSTELKQRIASAIEFLA